MDVNQLAALAIKESDQNKEAREMREDPDAHFKKLKAKIKLKVIKQYQEDVELKKQEFEKTNAPVTVIKDKFGRVMDKQAPKMSKKRLPSVNRRPRKRPPLTKKHSFTEAQQKFYGAEDIYNPMNNYPKPLLSDIYVINMMKEAGRYPIPEQLVGRSKREPYQLRVDSLINMAYREENIREWAEYRQEIDAPYCSMESEEEFPLYDS